MKIFRMVIAGMLLIGVGICIKGCGTSIQIPTEEEARAADYGTCPENFKDIVINYMSEILIDPESARYSNWKGPKKGWAGKTPYGFRFGYGVCVDINAKNRMGGYTGIQRTFLILHNDEVVYHQGGYRVGSIGDAEVCKKCDTIPNTEDITCK